MELSEFFQILIDQAHPIEVQTMPKFGKTDSRTCVRWYGKLLLEQTLLPQDQRDIGKIRSSWSSVKEHGIKLGLFEQFKGNNEIRERLREFLAE